MKDKPIITSGQLMTLLFVSRISLSLLYTSTLSGKASPWELLLPLLLFLPVMLILLLPCFWLYRRREQAPSLFGQSSRQTTGKLLPILYGLYFSGSAVFGLASLFDFMQAVVPEGIAPKLLLTFLLTGCIYASVKGIEASARMSAVVAALMVLSAVLSVSLLMPGFQTRNIPVYQGFSFSAVTDGLLFLLSRMNSVTAIHVLSPHLKGNLRRSIKVYISVSLLILLVMLIVLQGSSGDYLLSRTRQVYDGLEASGTLQRLDPIFILVIVCSAFCHLSLLLLCAAESLNAAFPEQSGRKLSILCGSFLWIVMLLFSDGVSVVLCNRYLWAVINVVFLTVIPMGVFVISKLGRGLHRRIALQGTASLLLLTLMLFLFPGCGSIQLNQRIIIQGIGIDRNADRYQLTFITLDTEKADSENSSKLLYAEGMTPEQAIGSLETERGKRALFSQCLFIMLNPEATAHLRESLAYCADLRDIQNSTNLMTAEDTAERTITTAVNELGYHAEDINMLTDSKAVVQSGVHCSLMEQQSERGALRLPVVVLQTRTHSLHINGSYLADQSSR